MNIYQESSSYIKFTIDALKAKTKATDKINILKNISTSPYEADFLRILTATYNPYINFYIKNIPLNYDNVPGKNDITDPNSLEILRKLSSREITGNAAKTELFRLYRNLTKDSRFILEKIIDKSFDCGISIKTINKVWPGKIPEFNVMLCHPLNDNTESKLVYPVYAQVKYDAARINIIVKDNKVRYFTRNGKEYLIENYVLDNNFLLMAHGEDVVFDGELFKNDSGRLNSNAVATKFVRGTASADDHLNVRIVLWDVIPLNDFIQGKGNVSYEKRFNELTKMYDIYKVGNKLFSESDINISLAETHEFNKFIDVIKFNEDCIVKGLEGIIVKNKHSVWEAKRSYNTLKMKEELESELKVIGIAEGTGKYEGLCGALICSSEDGLVNVSVGTGLNDNQRELYKPDNKNAIINKIITVRHNGIISNVSGAYSLYLPRLVEVRVDKTEADTLQKITNEGK